MKTQLAMEGERADREGGGVTASLRWSMLDSRARESLQAVPSPLGAPASRAAVRLMPAAERLGVVSELTDALNLATRSGQEHLMNKVLAILRDEILELRAPLFGSELARLRDAMSDLEHEAGRIAPLPSDFSRHAQVIIEALLRASDTSVLSTL
jgi:hypothetical protein